MCKHGNKIVKHVDLNSKNYVGMGITNKSFDENLKKRFPNTHKFSNHDIKKLILLLRNIVYLHEYMDHWKKLNETSLPKKENYSSYLKMKDAIDVGYMQLETVCKDFQIKILGYYYVCTLKASDNC